MPAPTFHWGAAPNPAGQGPVLGKSTLCILFADYLANKGLPVAVIDADLQQSIVVQRQRELETEKREADNVPWDAVTVDTGTLAGVEEAMGLKFKIWFLPNRIDDRKKADLEQLKLDTWKALHNYGDILTRINDRAYLERCSTLSLSGQQNGAVTYAFDRIITEIEENEK